MAKELWDAYGREGTPLGFDLVQGELLPYEEFKRVLMEDQFVEVIRHRFLDHQEAYDRIITEHFE